MGCDQWVLDKIAQEEAAKKSSKVPVKVEIKEDKVPEKKVIRGRR